MVQARERDFIQICYPNDNSTQNNTMANEYINDNPFAIIVWINNNKQNHCFIGHY